MRLGKIAVYWCVATALQIALGIALVTRWERRIYVSLKREAF